jgi:hypothetical protein
MQEIFLQGHILSTAEDALYEVLWQFLSVSKD